MRSMMFGATLAILSALPGGVALAAGDPAACKTVKFSDVGWTDITATTATASAVLKGLGYAPHTDVLSVPVTYQSLHAKQVDVFLGNWMPTMEADRKPYVDDHTVDVVGTNLTGAKYTLAVPDYVYAEGLKPSPTSPSSRTNWTARSTASSPATTATA